MKVAVCVFVAALIVMAMAETAAPRSRRAVSPFARVTPAPDAPGDPRLPPYTIYWYDQEIDHFNFANSGTWKQRYLIVDKYYTPGHPILFYTGNEGDMMMFFSNTGFMFELAKQWGALVIFAEHRFYGQSLPFGSESFTNKNLGLLSVEQAMADYAALLTWFKNENPKYANAPILSFGGSYGGMLTAWFRMTYPHIVAGGLAASAPLVQFVGLYPDYDLFNQIVTNDYTKADATCSNSIRAAFKALTTVQSSEYGKLTSTFNLCSPISSANDVNSLLNYIENAITYMAMTDYPDATNFLQPLPAWPVKASCVAANKASSPSNVYAAIAAATNVYYNTSGLLKCNNLNAPASGGLGDQSWDYQACTELVLPSTATGVKDFFPPQTFIETQYSAGCRQQFDVTPRYRWIPTQYGGFNITAHSNIIFSNGNLDPWSGGGITYSISSSLPAIIIDQGAHHLDLRFSSPADPQSVVVARQQEASYLRQWARDWYHREGILSPI